MTDLDWYDLFPPRGLDLEAVTRLVRPLASRPRVGLLRRATPVVVFELWVHDGRIHWLAGMDPLLSHTVPSQMQTHLPGLGLSPHAVGSLPPPVLACDVKLRGLSEPLRLDVAASVSAGLLGTLGKLGKRESAVVQLVVGPAQPRAEVPRRFGLMESLGLVEPAPIEPGLRQSWRAKTAEPLFAVRVRVGANSSTFERMEGVIHSLVNSLCLSNTPHTALTPTACSPRAAEDLLTVSTPGAAWGCVFNAAELAMLLGFPVDGTIVPGRSLVLGRPPGQLLRCPDLSADHRGERVLGVSLHPADAGKLVTLPLATSMHNVAISGPTGSGKSNELAQLILSDVHAGHGVLVIEPRGDLVEDVLSRMPEDRWHDVVVIDPAESDQIGVNPLAGPRGDAERRADELVNLFRALFGTAIGPRSADMLLHTLITAARLDDGTLADVPVLLSNPGFRRRVLATVTDPLVLGPWWAWFDGLSEAEQRQVSAPVTNKLRAFLSRTTIRRMLAQGKPAFSLDKLFLRRPLVVFVNLNRGAIGPEAAGILGSLLLTSSWQAAQRRAALPRDKRFPVNLIIDEFQDYVGALDFGEVLAQCRGLNVSVTVANQHLSQLSPELRAAVTSNARSRLAFRPSTDDVKGLAAVFGEPVTPDDLERLGAFEVCARLLVDSAMTAPFAVKTLPLSPATSDPNELRRISRKRYGVDGPTVDAGLQERWQSGTGKPGEPIGTRRRQPS